MIPEYIANGQERRWLDDLCHGKSMIIVGERGSGLSTVANYLLDLKEKNDALLARGSAIRVSAKLLSPGTQFLCDLAYECVRSMYEGSPSDEVERLLVQLRSGFNHYHLVALLEAIRRDHFVPLVVIDRFENLAIKLDQEAWASVRYLLEQRLLQMLFLSRLSVAEVETLADSKFGQTIKQEILSPLHDYVARRHFVESVAGGVAFGDEAILYVAELAGGHRSLMVILCSLIASKAGGIEVDIPLIDEVVGAHRDEIRSRLVSMFKGLSPGADPLRAEFEAELQGAFEVDNAPFWIVSVHSPLIQRLRRLGHLRLEDAGTVRFSSSLLKSELRRRWIEGRPSAVEIAGYHDWVEYDDILRRLIRSRIRESAERILEASGLYDDVLGEWKRDRIWWGGSQGYDILDYLRADRLHPLLTRTEIGLRTWCEREKDCIERVNAARKDVGDSPWNLLSPERRQEASVALESLRTRALVLLEGAEGDSVSASDSCGLQLSRRSRSVRWLHISDVHFRADRPYGEDLVLRAFMETLKQDRHSGRLFPGVDLVFFTGDIAFSGKAEEYARAERFFNEVLAILGLGKERLFCIPGNHDVDRQGARYLNRSFSEPRDVHAAFLDQRWRRLYSERLANFNGFHSAFFRDIPGRLDSTSYGFIAPHVIEINGVGLVVLAINSQWCGGLDDDQGKLVAGFSLLYEEVAGLLNGGDLRIALMHQPLDHFSESEQEVFPLLARDIDVILRGHLHSNEVRHALSTRGEVLEFSAGALFSHPDYPNSAQVVEVALDDRRYSVYPLRYEARQHRWERDTSFGEAPDYIYRGSLPVRKIQGAL